jgi:NAD(P) transhydrogenase subunit alpha
MRVAVLRERRAAETRVAATPETVKKLIGMGCTVAVEAGAGSHAGIPDAAYRDAGAELAADPAAALAGAGIVLAVRAPEAAELALIPRGATLIGTLGADAEAAKGYAAAGIDACSMELLPRITRAQSMDVLSSQANLAGYRAVIEAADAFDRGFPMLMTAAGTIPAANVFVMGAGVAGLQAIATARRLGGRVSATDVRPAARRRSSRSAPASSATRTRRARRPRPPAATPSSCPRISTPSRPRWSPPTSPSRTSW